MAKNYNQIKSQLKRDERKFKQAIDKYNRSVRDLNSKIKKADSEYNRFVRNYNASVRKNQKLISREIKKLNTSSPSSYVISTQTMQKKYSRVGSDYDKERKITAKQCQILDLIDQEQANSVITTNALENNKLPEENTEDVEIGNKLLQISDDLNNRWKGAVYALNPNNPDAARHFCTSAREILTGLIEIKAPDADVVSFNPNCKKTENGTPTRKEKIKFMMRNCEMDSSVVDFADEDINNIVKLIHVLSGGTHGPAGEYEFDVLLQVKRRVEQGINFLCEISG